MKCDGIESKLISYMDGRAADAERREVELHLVACAACRARVQEFQSLWGALDAMPAVEPSPAFDARLRASMAAEPRRGWGWLAPVPRLAFAVTLLAVLSVWIGSRPDADVEMSDIPMFEQKASDLQALEDYDVLANFEPLSELPPAATNPM